MIQTMVCVNNKNGFEDELVMGKTYKVDMFANGYCDVRHDDLSIHIEDTHGSRFERLEIYEANERRDKAFSSFQSLPIEEQEALLQSAIDAAA